MLEKQTPWVNRPRSPVAPKADNNIALSTQQILQIAGILGSTVEHDLVAARAAWREYQSTRNVTQCTDTCPQCLK